MDKCQFDFNHNFDKFGRILLLIPTFFFVLEHQSADWSVLNGMKCFLGHIGADIVVEFDIKAFNSLKIVRK